MDAIIIERSAYEELQTGFNSFVNKMKAMANRGTDKKMGKWLDNSEVISSLHISLRTLQTLRDNGTLAYSQIERKIYYKPEDIEKIMHKVNDRKKDACWRTHDKEARQSKQCEQGQQGV